MEAYTTLHQARLITKLTSHSVLKLAAAGFIRTMTRGNPFILTFNRQDLERYVNADVALPREISGGIR
jgi:hypothetical protein